MMKRLLIFALIACCSPLTAIFFSCTPVCDYPESRQAKLRLINAMPDQDMITVWLNGRVFKKDYTYEVPCDSCYSTRFFDGSGLGTGKTHITVTSDAAGRDTIFVDSANLTLNRETIIIIGRAHTKLSVEKNTKKALLLDDEHYPSDSHTWIRFIHAIPDLPSLDINWDSTATPNATFAYGENVVQYFNLDSTKRLLMTEAGNPSNVIALIPYNFNSKDFKLTAVIRGRTKPVGKEYTASTLLLSDAPVGNAVLTFKTFGLRMMNASRAETLSLLVKSPTDQGIRSNYPQQQASVIDIPSDSLSKYFALNPLLNSNSKYYYSKNHDTSPLDILDSVSQAASVDQRYTFVTIEKIPFGQSGSALDHLVLLDTLSCPSDTNVTRVRMVMATPDHPSITVSFGTKTVTMTNKQVEFFDIPVGVKQLQLSDGASNRTVSVTVNGGRPMSIYLLPRQASEQFPIKAVIE